MNRRRKRSIASRKFKKVFEKSIAVAQQELTKEHIFAPYPLTPDNVYDWGLANNNRRRRQHKPLIRQGCTYYKDIKTAKRMMKTGRWIFDPQISERNNRLYCHYRITNEHPQNFIF